MKKIYLLFYAAILLGVVSCSNQTSEKVEPVTTTPANIPAAKSTPAPIVKEDNIEVRQKDTPRTEISIGQKGGSIKTKTGTGVSIDDKGIKVGSKDVKIDIKQD